MRGICYAPCINHPFLGLAELLCTVPIYKYFMADSALNLTLYFPAYLFVRASVDPELKLAIEVSGHWVTTTKLEIKRNKKEDKGTYDFQYDLD